MKDVICAGCGDAHRPDDPCASGPDARVGTLLDGRYEITRVLGAGGMGKVYEARNVRVGRKVAIKFLRSLYATHPEVLRRFENEARAVGPLDHENIAAVHDFGDDGGTRFLVMDLLVGEDCERLLEREGVLPVARAVDIVRQVCGGLDVAHRAGVVHRDLKPANLFVTKRAARTDLVKILDFGIAKLRSGSEAAGTRTGLALGTPHYMSPEQARGDRGIDHRTDIYSLGVILYQLLGGETPHRGDSYLEIIYSILHTTPKPLEAIREALPAGLSQVVATAMGADPSGRYESAAALAEALLPFAGGRVASPRAEESLLPAPIGSDQATLPSAGTSREPEPRLSGELGADPARSKRADPNENGARRSRAWLVALSAAAVGLLGTAVGARGRSVPDRPARAATVALSIAAETGHPPGEIVALQIVDAVSERLRPDSPSGRVDAAAEPNEAPVSLRPRKPGDEPKRRVSPAESAPLPVAPSPATDAAGAAVDIAREPAF
jgi:serine/threonine-protein kinase